MLTVTGEGSCEIWIRFSHPNALSLLTNEHTGSYQKDHITKSRKLNYSYMLDDNTAI